ncbi:MAG: hypothetical protein EBU08_19910 [Micrococcales bacterium]|jgi:hypothetical protein|nr:hypothetical protein [Micrococcales bacterium]
MMKLAVIALLLFLVLNPSQAKTIDAVQVLESPKRSELMNPMRTKSVLVRVVPRHKKQTLITNSELDDSDSGPVSEEIDLHVAYRRPELIRDALTDWDDVSDYVAVRLAVARARAMQAFRQKNCAAENKTV